MTQGRPFGDLLAMPLRSGVTVAASDRGAGIKMLNMGELFRYPQIPDVEMARVDLGKFDPERVLLRPGDLMFARRSLTLEGAGKCSIVKEINEPTTWESSIIRARLDHAVAHPPYYFYFFGSPLGRRLVETIVEQVAAAGIRLSELRTLTVPLPDLREQQAIAQVLGALDDKIGANSRRMETIDLYLAAVFDEIRSRCEQQGFLRDVADINGDSVKPVAGGTLRYIDIASVGVGDYEYPAVIAWEEAPSRARRGVRKGDTIWSTVRPNRRSHALNLSADPLLVASTGLAVLSPREVGFAYLYEVTKHPAFTTYLESAAEGSAYPAVRADRFGDALIPMFPRAEHDGFEATAAPMRELAHSLEVETRTLSATRDALLPQLMSGDIRVKTAEKTFGEVL
jgi:type I restriction enzyme S subunit